MRQPALLSRFAVLGFARRLVRRRGKMHVSQSAAPSTRYHYLLALFHQIRDQFLRIRIAHYRTTWYLEHNILTLRAVHLLTRPGLANTRLEMLAITVINQRIQIRGGLHVNATAASSIAPIRPAERRELLATKVNRSIPPIASFDKDFCMVVKHVFYHISEKANKLP